MSGGFEDLGLLPELVKATQEIGWMLPSDVQDETIPLMLGGGDVMVAAETGSGKTGAFALPAIQLAHEIRQSDIRSTSSSRSNANSQNAQPKLSISDRTSFVAVASDGATVQSRQEFKWGGIRGDWGVLSGKWYYEVTVHDEGLVRVGWSTAAASYDLGTDAHGYGYGGTGKKSNNRNFDNYGEAFGLNDVISCCVDLESGCISFRKNGIDLGTAFTLPSQFRGPLYPAICLKNAEVSVNFGQEPFKFDIPCGLKSLASAEADDANIVVAPIIAKPVNKESLSNDPLVLVLEPARELAEQTAKEVERLAEFISSPPTRQMLLMGGVDTKKATNIARRGVDIVTATCRKLLDFVDSGKLKLNRLRLLVLDEADRLCDKEGLVMIDKIWQHIRQDRAPEHQLQVCFFSATLHSKEIQDLGNQYCHHPTWVDLKGKDSVPDTVHHAVVHIDPNDVETYAGWEGKTNDPTSDVTTDHVHIKDRVSADATGKPQNELAASEAIKKLKPAVLVELLDALDMEQVLVFCRTNLDCNNLEKYLVARGGGRKFNPRFKSEKGKENPYSCCVLAGQRSMEERRGALTAFKEGDARILIATDVAARGIDIKELPYVVNMTLPDETENYIHRIGRVGRADRMGLAISLVASTKEKVWYYDKRKWANKPLSTKLAGEGGCCIWYDEPNLLKLIEQRVGLCNQSDGKASGTERIQVIRDGGRSSQNAQVKNGLSRGGQKLNWSFLLPSNMGDGQNGVVYGEEKGRTGLQSAHVAAIASTVETLSALEVQAQRSYHSLQSLFNANGSLEAFGTLHNALPNVQLNVNADVNAASSAVTSDSAVASGSAVASDSTGASDSAESKKPPNITTNSPGRGGTRRRGRGNDTVANASNGSPRKRGRGGGPRGRGRGRGRGNTRKHDA